jgi:hypothetical protein
MMEMIIKWNWSRYIIQKRRIQTRNSFSEHSVNSTAEPYRTGDFIQ